jgi:hypothetical protein
MGSKASSAARGLNLNTARAQRAKARAALRGATQATLPIILGDGDKVIAELGPELPLETLAPLLEVEVDIPTLVVQLLEAASKMSGDGDGGDTARAEAATEAIVGVLVTNPRLPIALVEAAQEIGRGLLTDEGYEAFIAERPSYQDVAALISGLLDWYGISLGEFLGSSPSVTDGGTSKPISPTTTPADASMGSGDGPASPASSESALSPT